MSAGPARHAYKRWYACGITASVGPCCVSAAQALYQFGFAIACMHAFQSGSIRC
jgi:hypothetical protein